MAQEPNTPRRPPPPQSRPPTDPYCLFENDKARRFELPPNSSLWEPLDSLRVAQQRSSTP